MALRKRSKGELTTKLMAFLEEDEWHPTLQVSEELIRIDTRFETPETSWAFIILVDEETRILTFYSILDTKTPKERFNDMTRFITRSNFGMRIGKFELDLDDGTVRFQSGHIAEGHDPNRALIQRHCYNNVNTMTQYFSGFMKVMCAGNSPDGVLEEIEGTVEEVEYVHGKDDAANIYIR